MGYDFSKSDLFMMVGGQIALLVLVILVVWFGVGPLQFAYANEVEKMLNGINSSTNVAANAKSVVSVAPNAKNAAPIVKSVANPKSK
jgi:preprotein translocase subunit YajC